MFDRVVDFLNSTVAGKSIKAALYVGVSASLAAFVTALTNNPDMFGAWTVIINAILVAVQKSISTDLPKV